MARFAGQAFEATPIKQKPVIGEFNTEDFQQQPQEVAIAPAIPIAAGLAGKAMKAYGAFKLAEKTLDGGRVSTGEVETGPGSRPEYNLIEKLGQRIFRADR